MMFVHKQFAVTSRSLRHANPELRTKRSSQIVIRWVYVVHAGGWGLTASPAGRAEHIRNVLHCHIYAETSRHAMQPVQTGPMNHEPPAWSSPCLCNIYMHTTWTCSGQSSVRMSVARQTGSTASLHLSPRYAIHGPTGQMFRSSSNDRISCASGDRC